MALTPSRMVELGSKAPDFQLPEPGGSLVALDDFRESPILVVMFLCNHCPYVKHIRHEVAALATEYLAKNVAFVAINSNDAETHPDDGTEAMIAEKATIGYRFPYLYDESQAVALAYQATCTPDFFVYDSSRSLIYRGQFDGSRPGNPIPVDGKDLRWALDLALDHRPIPDGQKPSMGCNIKWRKENQAKLGD